MLPITSLLLLALGLVFVASVILTVWHVAKAPMGMEDAEGFHAVVAVRSNDAATANALAARTIQSMAEVALQR